MKIIINNDVPVDLKCFNKNGKKGICKKVQAELSSEFNNVVSQF